MTKTTYVTTAPDGPQHTRKTGRTYTHSVLLEGEDGWGAVGLCGSSRPRREEAQLYISACASSIALELVYLAW